VFARLEVWVNKMFSPQGFGALNNLRVVRWSITWWGLGVLVIGNETRFQSVVASNYFLNCLSTKMKVTLNENIK
jgi:hypothetical protein